MKYISVNYQLSVLKGELKNKVYPISAPFLKIGRMPDNDIVFKEDLVSRYHSRISIKNNTFFIEDLKSKNGTFVNNVRVTRKRLRAGDMITIGSNALLFDTAKKDIFSEKDEVEFTTIKPAKKILKDIADKAVDYSSAEIVEILRSKNEILNAIYELSKSILRISAFETILELTTEAIFNNVTGVDRVYILVKDKETGLTTPVFQKILKGFQQIMIN